MIQIPVLVLMPLIAVLTVACSQPTVDDAIFLPRELVVVDGAKNVQRSRESDGRVGVSYRLSITFPASALLRTIDQALPRNEWQPLVNDWLNPDTPSSHKRGWMEFIDGTKNPETDVHLWMGQWRDSAGNIVLYALRYDSKRDTSTDGERPNNNDLLVNAVRVPAASAQKMMKLAADGRGVS